MHEGVQFMQWLSASFSKCQKNTNMPAYI